MKCIIIKEITYTASSMVWCFIDTWLPVAVASTHEYPMDHEAKHAKCSKAFSLGLGRGGGS